MTTREEGFTSTEVVAAAGISYRQLDYWSWKGYAQPSINPAKGYGSIRRYSLQDAVTITIIGNLARIGIAIDEAVKIAARPVTTNDQILLKTDSILLTVNVGRVRAVVSKALGVEEESDGEAG